MLHYILIPNSTNRLYRSHRNHSHWADLSIKLSQLLGLARTRGRGRLPLVAEERAGISRGSRGQNALKGHSINTWTQFCPFVTTYLPQQSTWTCLTLNVDKIDGFSTYPPLFIHVLIECLQTAVNSGRIFAQGSEATWRQSKIRSTSQTTYLQILCISCHQLSFTQQSRRNRRWAPQLFGFWADQLILLQPGGSKLGNKLMGDEWWHWFGFGLFWFLPSFMVRKRP